MVRVLMTLLVRDKENVIVANLRTAWRPGSNTSRSPTTCRRTTRNGCWPRLLRRAW